MSDSAVTDDYSDLEVAATAALDDQWEGRTEEQRRSNVHAAMRYANVARPRRILALIAALRGATVPDGTRRLLDEQAGRRTDA